jgi:saccharopine dehydrogenase-like NADP-dependent oxidoreductase
MNDFGQFDSVSFNNGNWVEYDNKTTTYRQDNYRVVNNQYVYTNGNRGLTTLNKTSEKSLTVVTSYSLYDEVLTDMMLSTSHYLVDGETIIPLILDVNKLKVWDKVSSMLNSVPLTFNYANKININL